MRGPLQDCFGSKAGTAGRIGTTCDAPDGGSAQDPLKAVNALLQTADGVRIEKNDRRCGESGTFAVTRPDIAMQVRFRKEEEMRRGRRGCVQGATAATRPGSPAR